MLNQIFGGPQNIGDVEFWHGPERAGWLMKQGMHALLGACERRRRLGLLIPPPPPHCIRPSSQVTTGKTHDAVFRPCRARVRPSNTGPRSSDVAGGMHDLLCVRCSGEYIKTWRRRWFVLKQGKIFWFKSDIITPVRAHASLSRPFACWSARFCTMRS